MGNWAVGCLLGIGLVLRTTPKPCLDPPISHYIESRGSTEGNRGSRIEGAIGEVRVDELRVVDSLLSRRIAKEIVRRMLRVESPLQPLARGS